MKKVKTKNVGGVLSPISELPVGIAVYCDGTDYYVEEFNDKPTDTKFKALRASIKAQEVPQGPSLVPEGVTNV